MKKILIGGCSFTEKKHGRGEWKPWSDLFSEELYIRNVAQSSYGQGMISKSIVNEIEVSKFKPDFVIIQWSSIQRGYSTNLKEFFSSVVKNKETAFLTHDYEYLNEESKMSPQHIEDEFILASFTHILLTKNYLESKNIPYLMFWGWNQFNNVNKKLSNLFINKIYDSDWWIYGEHGGMSEFINEEIGKSALATDGKHPSTKGHKLFYDKIIKKIL